MVHNWRLQKTQLFLLKSTEDAGTFWPIACFDRRNLRQTHKVKEDFPNYSKTLLEQELNLITTVKTMVGIFSFSQFV